MAAASKSTAGEDAPRHDGALPLRWFAAAAIVAAGWLTATIVLSSRVDGEAGRMFGLFAVTVTLAATTGVALWTALRGDGDERRWRLLLTAATATGTVKAALVAWHATASESPTSSPVSFQAGDIVAGLFLVAALAAIPTSPVTAPGEPADAADSRRPWWHHHRVTALDGVMIITSAMLLRWVTVLRPGFDARAQSAIDAGVTIALNLTGVLVVTALLLILASRRPHNPRVLALTGTGVVLLVLAQAENANPAATPDASPSLRATALIVAGVLCQGLAATVPSRKHGHRASRRVQRPAVWFRVLLPYLPLAALIPLAVAHLATGDRAGGGVEIGLGLAVVCVVLVRQVVTLVQNAWLLAGLHENQRLLQHRAYHDELTGLPNRAFLLERLARLTDDDGSPDGQRRALLFCDLDDFKLVNDQLGHDVGDVVLQLAAARLRTCVRAEDLVARLGGDEFAILLSAGADDPTAVGSRVVSAMELPFEIADHRCSVRASVGITQLRSSATQDSPLTVLRRADAAMYAAKRGGKDGVAIIDT